MDWFEHEEKYSLHYSSTVSQYDDNNLQLQWEIGELTMINTRAQEIAKQGHSSNNEKGINCMHWVQSMYQADLCALGLDADNTVFLMNGQLYKQKHLTTNFPGEIQSLPLFHFQEWKRKYRSNQIEPLMHSAELRSPGFVLTKNGVLPLPSVDYSPSVSVVSKQLNSWAKAKNKKHHTDLPTSIFCLRSSVRKFPPSPLSSECDEFGMSFTATFSFLRFKSYKKILKISIALLYILKPRGKTKNILTSLLMEKHGKMWI